MPSFSVGQKRTTTTPTIDVDAGLAIGAHQFQLEVIDDSGNVSRPDVAEVVVRRVGIPDIIDTHPPIHVPGPVIGPGPVITGPSGPLPPVHGPGPGPVIAVPSDTSPPVHAPGPVITGPVVHPHVIPAPAVVIPRGAGPKPRSKRSKPK